MQRKGMGTFNHDAKSLDFDGRGLIMPRAVRKILQWIEEHPDDKSPEALYAGTGYSPDEQAVILQYWGNKADKEIDRMNREEATQHFFDDIVDELLDVL